SRRRHTSFSRDWSSDVCSSDLEKGLSVGSAFTLNSLAKALGVETKDLVSQKSSNQPLGSVNTNCVKLMNLCALGVIVIPLANIFIPVIIFWKNRNLDAINNYGRRILSFQILWTLVTMLLMILVPVVLLLLFKPL